MSRFSTVPTIRAPRSKFKLDYDNKTSMSVGTLYPVYVQEIYPGDTFTCNTSFVARVSSSFLRPVMDNLFIDFMYFFVPNRLVFEDFPSVFGENKNSAWAPTTETVVPTVPALTVAEAPIVSKSVGDYMGLPVKALALEGINILPFRAFAKIYDDWFRDENLIDPMHIQTGSFADSERFNSQPWSPSNYTGMLPKVAKFHDVFTSSLPNTQKSAEPVQVPIGSYAPVVTREGVNSWNLPWQISTNLTNGSAGVLNFNSNTVGNGLRTVGVNTDSVAGGQFNIDGSNLYADLASAGLLNVTDLRYAFQLQRILERSARSGTRYTEYLLSAFGVMSPDARLQRSEYLGGKRLPISVQQVAQTNRGDTEDTELGSLGAFSLTNGKCGYQKGFVEHGFVIGVACIRQYHTYQQGIEKFWQRSHRFDYYDPILANISEVPVYRSEIFALTDSTVKGGIFGFQEAWYDLRNRMSLCTGDMRSASDTSLDIWHFADDYTNAPSLTPSFINETPEFVDRTIAVPSSSLDQFIVDIYHQQSAIRCLPPYSIPGLIDHH